MPGATFSGEDVANYIRRGVYDNHLIELSNAIEARDEARRTELHRRIQDVYGDEYEVVVRKREASDPTPLGLSRSVAVSVEDRREMLETAVRNTDIVTIDYTDANGSETTRDIMPFGIYGDRCRARDIDKDELRTFRLDRISRVEA